MGRSGCPHILCTQQVAQRLRILNDQDGRASSAQVLFQGSALAVQLRGQDRSLVACLKGDQSLLSLSQIGLRLDLLRFVKAQFVLAWGIQIVGCLDKTLRPAVRDGRCLP